MYISSPGAPAEARGAGAAAEEGLPGLYSTVL